jgi:preprotein translocase subunit SecG
MDKIILVVHLIVAIAMVLVVLVQRSEGAGLMGASQGSMMPVRGSGNPLTRATAILATIFFITSLTLAIMAGGHKRPASLAETIAAEQTVAPVTAPIDGAPTQAAPTQAPAATPAPAAADKASEKAPPVTP